MFRDIYFDNFYDSINEEWLSDVATIIKGTEEFPVVGSLTGSNNCWAELPWTWQLFESEGSWNERGVLKSSEGGVNLIILLSIITFMIAEQPE